jgi:hypothetical protein
MLGYVDIQDHRRLCLVQFQSAEGCGVSSLSPYDAYNFGVLKDNVEPSLISCTAFAGDIAPLLATSAEIAPIADPRVCLSYHSHSLLDFSASLRTYFAEGRLVHEHDVFEVPIVAEDARPALSAKFVRYRLTKIQWGPAGDCENIRLLRAIRCAVIKTSVATLHQNGVSFSTMPCGAWWFNRSAFVAPNINITTYSSRSTTNVVCLPIMDVMSLPASQRLLASLRFQPLLFALAERLQMQRCGCSNSAVCTISVESSSDLQSRLLLQASCVALGLHYIEIEADLLLASVASSANDGPRMLADTSDDATIIQWHPRSAATSAEASLEDAVSQITRMYGQCVCHVVRLPELCSRQGLDVATEAARMRVMLEGLSVTIANASSPVASTIAAAATTGAGIHADMNTWIEVDDGEDGTEQAAKAAPCPQFYPIVVVSGTGSQLGDGVRNGGRSLQVKGPSVPDALSLFSLCLGSSLSVEVRGTLCTAVDHQLRGASWDQVWRACNAVRDVSIARRASLISKEDIIEAFASLKVGLYRLLCSAQALRYTDEAVALQGLSPNSISAAGIPNVKWADVGGLQAAREEILRMV